MKKKDLDKICDGLCIMSVTVDLRLLLVVVIIDSESYLGYVRKDLS